MNKSLDLYEIGQIIVGTVITFTSTGASIDIGSDESIQIPLNQISRQKIKFAAEVLKIGETM